MIENFRKLLVLSALVGLVSCGGATSASKVPAATPPARVEVAPEASRSQVVETPRWKLSLPSEFVVVHDGRHEEGGALLELAAKTKSRYGAGPVIVMLVSAKAEQDPQDFIEQLVTGMQESGQIRVIKGGMGQVSGHPAAFMLTMRMTGGGQVLGAVEIVTADGKMGYSLMCGGDVESVDEFGDMCAEVMQSFSLK